MVTCLNDAHLRQKLYREGKDFTIEMALQIIRVYAAKHKAQGMTVNYLKGKGKGPYKSKAQPNNNKQALKGASPRTKTARTSVGNVEKEPLSKERNTKQLIRNVNSARNRDITRWNAYHIEL